MKKGILLIGHGSRYVFNKEAIEMQAAALEKRVGIKVWTAYNETTMPLVDMAVEDMVKDGVNEIIAIPFFIASGLHITRDIPKGLGIPENSTGGEVTVCGKKVKIHFEQPFGSDPVLTEILEKRIKDFNLPDSAIVVIGHGSRLPYNKEIISTNAERLKKKGHKFVFYGFNEYNEPSIEDAVKEAVKTDVESIIVLPLFITSGAHLGEEVPETLGIPVHSDGGISTKYGRSVNIKYAMPVGRDPRLVDVLVKKLEKYGI